MRSLSETENKKGRRNFRPFRGGVSLCPGQFLAIEGAKFFIMLALVRCGIRLADGEKNKGMPEMALAKPTAGLISPLVGQDVLIEVEEKVSE